MGDQSGRGFGKRRLTACGRRFPAKRHRGVIRLDIGCGGVCCFAVPASKVVRRRDAP